MKTVSGIVVVFLSLVSLAHLLRLFLRVAVTAGGVVVPLWVSVAGFLVPGTLAFLLWREGRR